MPKCFSLANSKLEPMLKDIIDDMLDGEYKKNADGKYVIPFDEKHSTIDYHVVYKMCSTEVVKLVERFGVFKAIKLYQDTYGEFELKDFGFLKTYAPLAYLIIDDYINENDLIFEEEDEESDDETST